LPRLVFGLGAAALSLPAAHAGAAEVELPRQSPPASVSQRVGLTDISVEYASPAVHGRKIWGAAVAWDKRWSISPSQPTKIRFSREVQLGGRPVAAGSYLLYVTPSKGDWTVALAKPPTSGPATGTAAAPADADLVRVKVRPKSGPHRERLTFAFTDFSDERAVLELAWEKLTLPIAIAVDTDRQVLTGINELESAWRSYANAARYMLEVKKDFDAGLKYVDQSLALKDDWYTRWIKASLLAAKGDWPGARGEGEKAYQLGQKLGETFTLENELRQNLAEWSRRADGVAAKGGK